MVLHFFFPEPLLFFFCKLYSHNGKLVPMRDVIVDQRIMNSCLGLMVLFSKQPSLTISCIQHGQPFYLFSNTLIIVGIGLSLDKILGHSPSMLLNAKITLWMISINNVREVLD